MIPCCCWAATRERFFGRAEDAIPGSKTMEHIFWNSKVVAGRRRGRASGWAENPFQGCKIVKHVRTRPDVKLRLRSLNTRLLNLVHRQATPQLTTYTTKSDSGLAYQAPRPAGTGDVPPLRSIQSGGFASILLVEKQNQVRWNGTRGPQLPGASFGVPEQTPREALDLKGTEVGDIATSLLGSGTFQPHSRVPSGTLGLKRPSSAQQAEGGECAAFYGL